jgi:2-polyprenyl-3-methyl-5-hydroxy-6-metoxy-1,4-benzoquinol methylase
LPKQELERLLRESWIENASAWTEAVREGRIPSRKAGTDAAIVEAVRDFPQCRVLDLGCGEGWLSRALQSFGYDVIGVDSSDSLIAKANALSSGRFLRLGYDELVSNPAELRGPFELIVANFSLLGENIHQLFRALRARLAPDGAILIQTLHPLNCGTNDRYESGWRVETFAHMRPVCCAPMPYYFRTFSKWVEELTAAGLTLVNSQEPLHPETGRPLSLLIQAARR